MTLRELFHADPEKLPGFWIYLPKESAGWTLETEVCIPPDSQEEPELDPAYVTRGYVSTLNIYDLEDILDIADQLTGRADDEVRLEGFLYYYRYDAFLPEIGAPPPPPAEEILKIEDRRFYDQLGSENSMNLCRAPGCSRGSVRFSVFCRVHHFESIHSRPCPFTD